MEEISNTNTIFRITFNDVRVLATIWTWCERGNQVARIIRLPFPTFGVSEDGHDYISSRLV